MRLAAGLHPDLLGTEGRGEAGEERGRKRRGWEGKGGVPPLCNFWLRA